MIRAFHFYKLDSIAPFITLCSQKTASKTFTSVQVLTSVCLVSSSLTFNWVNLIRIKSCNSLHYRRLRLSDGKSFIDSPLSGPYKIKEGKIISEELYQPNKAFKRFDIVTIDYFSKIDREKICQLQLIIRRI
jgi:hypothetical protein